MKLTVTNTHTMQKRIEEKADVVCGSPLPPTPTSPIAPSPSPEAHLALFRPWRSIRTQEGLRLGLPVLVAGTCVHTRVWMLVHTFVCGCPSSFSKSIPQFCPRVDRHRQEEEHLFTLLLLYLKKPDTSRSAAARCWSHRCWSHSQVLRPTRMP